MKDLNSLISQLNISDLQHTNPPLYQVIYELIKTLRKIIAALNGDISALSSAITNITNITNNMSGAMGPPGMDGMDGEVGPPGPPGSSEFVEWSVLTNGDPVTPELIFADGDVIMTHIP